MGKSDTPENRVKAEVLKYLELRHIYCWSNPSRCVRGSGTGLARSSYDIDKALQEAGYGKPPRPLFDDKVY